MVRNLPIVQFKLSGRTHLFCISVARYNSNDLTLNFTTETAIAGDGNGINNLTVVGPALLGASVTTIGSQEYQSPVRLSDATVLTGTNGTFTGALNGNENDLTLHFSDTTTIDGNNVFSNLMTAAREHQTKALQAL